MRYWYSINKASKGIRFKIPSATNGGALRNLWAVFWIWHCLQNRSWGFESFYPCHIRNGLNTAFKPFLCLLCCFSWLLILLKMNINFASGVFCFQRFRLLQHQFSINTNSLFFVYAYQILIHPEFFLWVYFYISNPSVTPFSLELSLFT